MKTLTKKITVDIMTITVELAIQWLANNHTSRRKNPAEIERLTRVILDDQWVINGEAIVLDAEGRLLDGQHRLEAIVLAGLPVSSVVVKGVDPSAADTIDQH